MQKNWKIIKIMEKPSAGELINSAMAKALSTSEVNASMGKIVAAPTAGASGIFPSALITVKEKFNFHDEDYDIVAFLQLEELVK